MPPSRFRVTSSTSTRSLPSHSLAGDAQYCMCGALSALCASVLACVLVLCSSDSTVRTLLCVWSGTA